MVHIPVNKELEMAEAIVILYINFFSPRLAKTVSFVILPCLTPNDFTCQARASGWERVNLAYLSISNFLNLSSPRPAKTVPFVILPCLTPTILLVKLEPLGGKGLRMEGLIYEGRGATWSSRRHIEGAFGTCHTTTNHGSQPTSSCWFYVVRKIRELGEKPSKHGRDQLLRLYSHELQVWEWTQAIPRWSPIQL